MKSVDKRIPIVALCGFLGAGKTTLLNHILSAQSDRKIAVIVNDFGSINVDSLLIASQTQDTVELSNGTICCAIGEDGIDEVVGRLAHQYSIIDMIIIEASGAAEPIHLVQSLTRLRNKYARFDSLLYVVDAFEYEETVKAHPEMEEHIESADFIVLNKLDSVEDKKKQKLKDHIHSITPSALLLESSYGQIDVEKLLGIIESDAPKESPKGGVQLTLGAQEAEHEHHHAHIHDKLISTTFRSSKPMDPELLMQFFDDPPVGLYRLKGWIDFGEKGEGHTFIVQLVASRWQMRVYKGRDTFDQTELLLIGNGDMDEKAALKRLGGCEDADPDNVTLDNRLFIPKYDRD